MSTRCEAERALLNAAQNVTKLAKFQDLPRKLNALQKSVAKPKTSATRITTAAYLDSVLAIVRAYPLEVEEQEADRSGTPLDFIGF